MVFQDCVACNRPMYLEMEGNTLNVLLRQPFDGNRDSGLVSYHVRPNGKLGDVTPILSTRGMVACHLCSFQGNTYVTNYISGSLFSTEGRLVIHHGQGPDPKRQEGPHTHMVLPSPDGRFLMNTDLGIDRIFIYDKELREVSSVSAPKGSGPRHLCVLDDTHVACADELSCAITLYSYCQGSLCFQTSLPLYRGAKNPLWKPAAVRKDGDKLYVSVRGMDRVLVFSWDGLNLAPVQSVACGGASPRDIIVDDGLLYCMNEGSSTVTMFALNPDNGMIGRKLNEELRIPGVLCAVIGS